jgi:phenylalanyl-tRNA synthetase alpha chain
MSLRDDLNRLAAEADAALARVTGADALEEFRVQFLGRNGTVPRLLRTLKDLPTAERRETGQEANALRTRVERLYAEKRAALGRSAPRAVDVTFPGRRPPRGHLHPLTQVRRDVEDVFLSMGFEIQETPDVEEARYNFDLVNIPLGHPARDLMDTFWLTDGRLLRTHTSAGQARVMTGRTPPFRMLLPGRVFRREATDASHETTFHQFEGLFVDRTASLAEFKGVVSAALPKLLRRTVRLRVRPSYFPFVEPGVEVDASCFFCTTGCRICKGTRWIELMGAGMVHPAVLKNVGVNPRAFRGFAFGGSIDRMAMLRFNIPDIRLLWSGDPAFLHQF